MDPIATTIDSSPGGGGGGLSIKKDIFCHSEDGTESMDTFPLDVSGDIKDEDDELREAKLLMKIRGLPTSFARTALAPQQPSPPSNERMRKEKKPWFECRICNITELNSIDTKRSHERGQKHKLNVLKHLEEQQRHGKEVKIPLIREVTPPRSMEKKPSVNLSDRIVATNRVMVGLEYVRETIACSSEQEPYYDCDLCDTKGISNMMIEHIAGSKHKRKFLEVKVGAGRVSDLTPVEEQNMLECYRQNDQPHKLITTIYSDEMYPWDLGKAPWSVEQGGTGRAPTNARRGGGGGGGSVAAATAAAFGSDCKDGILLGADGDRALRSILKRVNGGLKPTSVDGIRCAYSICEKLVDAASQQQHHLADQPVLAIIVSSVKMGIATLRTMDRKDDLAPRKDLFRGGSSRNSNLEPLGKTCHQTNGGKDHRDRSERRGRDDGRFLDRYEMRASEIKREPR